MYLLGPGAEALLEAQLGPSPMYRYGSTVVFPKDNDRPEKAWMQSLSTGTESAAIESTRGPSFQSPNT